jgi:hypothetical protein
MMSGQPLPEPEARVAAKVPRECAADELGRYNRIADAVIAEFARPTDAMIDAAYEPSACLRHSNGSYDVRTAQPSLARGRRAEEGPNRHTLAILNS